MLLLLVACQTVALDTTGNPKGETDTSAVDSADTSGGGGGGGGGADTEETGDSGDTGTGLEDYAPGNGPYTVLATDNRIDGQDVSWYQPDTPGPWPVLIWSHGFGRNKDYHVDAATHAASWGFLVVTPNLPNFSDHEANGEWLAEQVYPTALAESGATPEQVGFVGHSAGGLASLVAAALVTSGAYVGLDPVDVSDLGVGYAPQVEEPALILHGDPSSCNSDGNSDAWTTAGDEWQVQVTDATHCDFESNTDAICTMFCGENDAARQAVIETYSVAWAVHHLIGGADDYLETGSAAAADRAAGNLSW